MLWQVPRLWEGGRCFILGGGPSMPRQFGVPEELITEVLQGADPSLYSPYFKPIHKEHVIGVNMAIKLGDWIDVMFFGDDNFWNVRKYEIINYKGIRTTIIDKAKREIPSKIKLLKRDPKKVGISKNKSMLCWNFNSGSAAINLAVHFGAKQIILLGFDMKLDKSSNQHWHKYYYSGKAVQSNFRKHLESFPQIAADAKQMGIEILNANPDSRIDNFPKVSLKEVL